MRTVVRWIESEELMEDDYESRCGTSTRSWCPVVWQARHRRHDSRYFLRAEQDPYFGICLGMQTACINLLATFAG